MRRPPASLALAVAAASVAALVAVASSAVAVGSDPGIARQWGLHQIGAPSAWSTSVGSGVPIAVVDTGVDLDHEDLRGQVAAAVTCVGTGGDPAKCTTDGRDIQGHGSHVAGIAAAASNSVGVSGVAPGARLIAVRVFSKSKDLSGNDVYGASTDDINAGIRWAIRNVSGKGVINLSIGDELPVALGSAGFSDGVEEAWAAGWVTALAAGNEGNLLGLNGNEYGSLNAVVVGATGPSGDVATYSSPIGSAKWGVVAPGGDTPSCTEEPDKCVLSTYLGGQYAFLEGTSMATPHVAGGLAMLMSTGLSNSAAVQRLLATLDSSKTCGSGCKGRLDVARAVSGLASPSPAATAAPATTAAAAQGPGPTTTAARSPATTVRRATNAAPPGSEPPPTSEGASPGPSVVEETTTTMPVEPLSIDEAADAIDEARADGGDGAPTDDLPLGIVLVGLALLLVVGAATARRVATGGGGP